MKFNPFTSNTILGAVFAVVSWLLSPEVTATIHSPVVAAVMQGFGIIWAAYGVRKAIAKAALNVPQ